MMKMASYTFSVTHGNKEAVGASSMLLLQSFLELELFEHGSANPFVSLVSSVDFRLGQLRGSTLDSVYAKNALVTQFNNLLSIFGSVKDWQVPEKDIRQSLDEAVPKVVEFINQSIIAIQAGNQADAIKAIESARAELVKHSNLQF